MDWKKIKTEYITTDTSYRKLCEKYGVPYSNLSRRARAEGWPALRTQSEVKMTSKVIETHADKQADRIAKMQSIADEILQKIEDGVAECSARYLMADKQMLRQVTGALRDLKDVLSLKSDIDLEEQKARIAKLRKESEEEKRDNTVEVSFEGGDVEAWSE